MWTQNRHAVLPWDGRWASVPSAKLGSANMSLNWICSLLFCFGNAHSLNRGEDRVHYFLDGEVLMKEDLLWREKSSNEENSRGKPLLSITCICLVDSSSRNKVQCHPGPRAWALPIHSHSKERPESKVNSCIRMPRALKRVVIAGIIVAADSCCPAKWKICNSDHEVGSWVCCFR